MPVEAWVSAAKPQPVVQQPFGNTPPTDEQNPDEAMNANAEVEQSAELKAWENFAVKRIGKTGGREFVPRAIPIMQAAKIKAALKSAGSADDVRAVFGAERGDGEYKSDTRYLAEALLAAAEAVKGEQ